jgi:hypothetical protein
VADGEDSRVTHDRAVAIATDLRRLRFRYCNEAELQDGIAGAMTNLEYNVLREVILTPQDRVDFLVDGVGIEVKVKGPTAAVVRQLARYAQHDAIEALILVTTRLRHQPPRELNGKQVIVVALTLAGL